MPSKPGLPDPLEEAEGEYVLIERSSPALTAPGVGLMEFSVPS